MCGTLTNTLQYQFVHSCRLFSGLPRRNSNAGCDVYGRDSIDEESIAAAPMRSELWPAGLCAHVPNKFLETPPDIIFSSYFCHQEIAQSIYAKKGVSNKSTTRQCWFLAPRSPKHNSGNIALDAHLRRHHRPGAHKTHERAHSKSPSPKEYCFLHIICIRHSRAVSLCSLRVGDMADAQWTWYSPRRLYGSVSGWGGGWYDAKMSPLRALLAERSAMMFMLKVCGGLGNLCENLLFTWNTKWDYVYICTYENGKLYTSSYLACVKWLCGTLLLREWGVNMILGWHNSQVICQLVFVILTVFLIWLWSIYADSNEVRIRNYFLSTTNNVTCMSLVRSLYAILIFSKPSKCTINELLNMHSDFQPAPPMFVTRRAVNFLPIYTYSNCPTPWNNRRHCAPC